ncbi:rhodanese-like domain-containing protein [Desulfococcaceae bacterium HSG7]|nr:rhodanese-like domain-containing protein [Desulfococcaceae bacterium HSG7]
MKELRRARWLPYILALALTLALGLGCAATDKTAKKEVKTKAPETAKTGAKTKAPKKAWHFHDIVDVAYVQQYAKIPKPEDVLIIDSRPKRAKYDKGYLPTAINIPDTKFAKMTDKLPQKKDALLIFYCQGPT